MTASALTNLLGSADWWQRTIYYEIIKGNTLWRFVLVLLVLLTAMAAGLHRFYQDENLYQLLRLSLSF